MKLLVIGTSYETGCGFVQTYEGDDFKQLLSTIAQNHSYNQFDEEWFETKADTATFESMLEELDYDNGDGADYILTIIEVEGELIYHNFD